MNSRITFKALDTLFFRGSLPMQKGSFAPISLFPPPLSVIEGALCTAVLTQNVISFTAYKQGEAIEIEEIIGKPSSYKKPFTIKLFALTKCGKTYLPVPSTWYEEQNNGKRKIIFAQSCDKQLEILDFLGSVDNILFASSVNTLKPLSDFWVPVDCLINPTDNMSDLLLPNSAFFDYEYRTGIGLENKTVKKGALFSSVHIRLQDDVSFFVVLDKDLPLDENGFITLGGDKKVCSYSKQIDSQLDNLINSQKSKACQLFYSLVPIEATKENLSLILSSRKIQTISGWDLVKGFHKPTQSYIPSGAVFSENIDNKCLPIEA